MFGRRAPTPLEERLEHRFARPQLLELAVTHRSWANEQGIPEHYERLEFLGDAVLGLATAEWLYTAHPHLPEGELSKLKAQLVSRNHLARHAERLGLGESLRIGVGEERSGGRGKASLLADSLEGKPLEVVPNDLVIDRGGGVYFTDPDEHLWEIYSWLDGKRLGLAASDHDGSAVVVSAMFFNQPR